MGVPNLKLKAYNVFTLFIVKVMDNLKLEKKTVVSIKKNMSKISKMSF